MTYDTEIRPITFSDGFSFRLPAAFVRKHKIQPRTQYTVTKTRNGIRLTPTKVVVAKGARS